MRALRQREPPFGHRGRALCVAAALVAAATPAARAASPYEIAAEWRNGRLSCRSAPDGFAFRGIEYVPGLGVVAYGDRLMLRVHRQMPHVTLGLVPNRHDRLQPRYASLRQDPASSRRLMVKTQLERAGLERRLESRLVAFDPDRRTETEAEFPRPDGKRDWSVIRLLGNTDGRLFAYAGLVEPSGTASGVGDRTDVVRQDFYRFESGRWLRLTPLAHDVLHVRDACVVEGRLIVVGTTFARRRVGGLAARGLAAAAIVDNNWAITSLPPAAADWEVEALACGRTRESVHLLSRVGNASRLHRFDGATWNPVALPEGDTPLPALRFTAIAIDTHGIPWLASTRTDGDGTGRLHRYGGGSWEVYPLPAVAGVHSYFVSGLAFDDDGAGWAVANYGGDARFPEARGLLLTSEGTTWRYRDWSWSFLRQRYFGLLGAFR